MIANDRTGDWTEEKTTQAWSS